jgi:hypothetical protein
MLRAPAPRPNDGLCFKCGQPGHRARECRQNQNQLALPSNDRGNNQTRNYNTGSSAYGRGQANSIDIEEVQDQPGTVMGSLFVNLVPAYVLFDSAASHSFMSEAFALTHGIICDQLPNPLMVNTPAGQCQVSLVSHDVPIEIGGLVFLASLIPLQYSNIDLILGIDWLKAHAASFDCGANSIQVRHPSHEILVYYSHLVRDTEARFHSP